MGWFADRMDQNGMTVKELAKICRVSESLILILRGGGVTHPTFCDRIALALDLTAEEHNRLMPACRRTRLSPEEQSVMFAKLAFRRHVSRKREDENSKAKWYG